MQPQKARFKGLEDIVDIHLNKKDNGDEVKLFDHNDYDCLTLDFFKRLSFQF